MPQTIKDSLVFNALVFLHTLKEENYPSSATVIVNTLLAVFLPGTIGNLKPVNIIIFQADQSLLSFTLACSCFILGSLH